MIIAARLLLRTPHGFFRLLVLGLLVEALLMKAECSIMRRRSKLLQKALTRKYPCTQGTNFYSLNERTSIFLLDKRAAKNTLVT